MPKTLLKKIPISEEEFLRKIEKMYGEYAIEDIACHMKSDFRYNSFWVLEEMKSAARYVDYITAKVQTLKKEKIVIQTEINSNRDNVHTRYGAALSGTAAA